MTESMETAASLPSAAAAAAFAALTRRQLLVMTHALQSVAPVESIHLTDGERCG